MTQTATLSRWRESLQSFILTLLPPSEFHGWYVYPPILPAIYTFSRIRDASPIWLEERRSSRLEIGAGVAKCSKKGGTRYLRPQVDCIGCQLRIYMLRSGIHLYNSVIPLEPVVPTGKPLLQCHLRFLSYFPSDIDQSRSG